MPNGWPPSRIGWSCSISPPLGATSVGRWRPKCSNQPEVVAAIDANYVPVKINVDFFPATARQYGITSLPTEVIVVPTPQGEAVDAIRGRPDTSQYIGRLNQIAANARQRPAAVFAQVGARPANSTAPRQAPPAAPPGAWPRPDRYPDRWLDLPFPSDQGLRPARNCPRCRPRRWCRRRSPRPTPFA